MEHTPTPWRIGIRMGSKTRYIYHTDEERTRDGQIVEIDTVALEDDYLDEGDATFIVKAVNHHDELALLVRSAIARVELANAEGDPILSAWAMDAKNLLARMEV